MMGMEFVAGKQSRTPAPKLVSDIVQHAAEHGLIVESAGIYGNVLRFLCPLVVTDEQLDCGLDILEAAIEAAR
jgi:4-aminobutyrate aminotransferase/(S)-3-amino-2-methylpropionate transaminase